MATPPSSPSAAPLASAAAVGQSPTLSQTDGYCFEGIEAEDEFEAYEDVTDEGERDELERGEVLSPKIDDRDREQRKITLIDDGDMPDEGRAPKCNVGTMSAETSNPFNVSSREVIGGDSVMSLSEANKIPHSEDETKQIDKDVKDKQQTAPRLDVPLIRPRCLPPGAKTTKRNKRPALICNSFAKGWCIKGSSCRFLHIRDPVNVSDQQQESSGAAYQKKELHDEGAGTSLLTGLPGMATSAAAATTSCSCEVIELQVPEEIPRWKSKPEGLHKENPIIKLFNDGQKESLRENQYLDKESSVDADTSLHETFSSSPLMGSDINISSRASSYATSLAELAGERNQLGLHNGIIPNFNNFLNSSSCSSQMTAGISPPNHFLAGTKTSSCSSQMISSLFSSSSCKSGSFETPKHLGVGDRELHVSLPPNVSSFYGSESEYLSMPKLSGDPLPPSGFASKISTYDWEPSKPFQSSFLLSLGLSFAGSQCDPVSDGIEPPKFREKSSKFSSSSQGQSISNTHSPGSVNPPLKGISGTEYSGGGHIVDTIQENKICASKEKKLLTCAHVGDIIKTSEVHDNHNCTRLSDEPTKKKVKAGDEFVKELVKPTWCKGRLSKDAHKLIVKKAVDKVLNTLPATHIPIIQASADAYLAWNEKKLAKLVEAYIEKYGKSGQDTSLSNAACSK